jgi:hypothetical protein
MRIGRNREPRADRTLSLRVTRPEFLQGPAGNHLHTRSYHVTNFGDKRNCLCETPQLTKYACVTPDTAALRPAKQRRGAGCRRLG